MLSREDNELLTNTDRGTPMGDLLEGEVAVVMDEETVEVLVPPEA